VGLKIVEQPTLSDLHARYVPSRQSNLLPTDRL